MFCRVSYTVLFALTAMAADAGTYYVATDGKPENDGSSARPWPSVGYALSKAGSDHQYDNRPNQPKTVSLC
jgi:hypothetical protein